MLSLRVTAGNEQERAQVAALAAEVQEITGQSVEVAFVDQGYTGDETAEAAAAHGSALEVVKHTEAKRGFVLLPRRWVVERSSAWLMRYRRLRSEYETAVQSGVGWIYTAMIHRMVQLLAAA